MTQIAYQYGFTRWQDVYDSADNEALRKRRPNPNLLFPGDVVNIPEQPEASCLTEQHHEFTRIIPRRYISLKLFSYDSEALKSCDYKLWIEGRELDGKTDDDGRLCVEIPILCNQCILFIGHQVWELKLGHLNPITADCADDGISGIQARLMNLGYYHGPVDGIKTKALKLAIHEFQQAFGLQKTGIPDTATRDKLTKAHGS